MVLDFQQLIENCTSGTRILTQKFTQMFYQQRKYDFFGAQIRFQQSQIFYFWSNLFADNDLLQSFSRLYADILFSRMYQKCFTSP